MKKIFFTFLILLSVKGFSQNIDSLLSNLYFDSSVGALDMAGFNFTDNYTASPSYWALSFPESAVFHAELEYINALDSTESYQIRIGKGGQLYSFRSTFGESVPPQWRHQNWVESSYGGGTSYAPWVDEVWQMVCVDGDLHVSPDSNYFIHQAGVYLKTPAQTQPFYSPKVAEFYNAEEQSYTTVNWGQQAHTNQLETTGFTSRLLYYTKYTNLGKGILQVDNMIYNWGQDNISFLNMPWGGVRNSSLDHFFISSPSHTYTNTPETYGLGPVVETASTGGWVAWSNDEEGNSAALGMAHPITTNTNHSKFRYGDAGNLDANWNNRDYHVFEMIRFPSPGQLGFGKSMSFRYFYVLGANVDSVKNTILEHNLISQALDTAYTPNMNDVDSIRYYFQQSNSVITASIDQSSDGLLLRTSPYADSYPLFKITASNSSEYISSDPYYLSTVPWDGTTQSISLLGFLDKPSTLIVMNDTICSGENYYFTDGSIISNIMSDVSHINYLEASQTSWDSLIVTNIIVNDCMIGCTDSTANNYDPNANIDDASCEYTSDCEQIYVNLNQGWSIIAFYCATDIDASEAFSLYEAQLILAKDNLGNAYLPSWNFNGIGNLKRGYGYQIKMTEPIEYFNLCNP